MGARPAPIAGCARTIFCAAQHSLLHLNLRSLDLLRCTSKKILAPEDRRWAGPAESLATVRLVPRACSGILVP